MAKISLAKPQKGLVTLAGRYEFVDGFMTVPDGDVKAVMTILGRYYGCSVVKTETNASEGSEVVDQSLAKSSTRKTTA